eukprot:scaffold259022_cov34-Prasinocladus_malaysianus.AAC.3
MSTVRVQVRYKHGCVHVFIRVEYFIKLPPLMFCGGAVQPWRDAIALEPTTSSGDDGALTVLAEERTSLFKVIFRDLTCPLPLGYACLSIPRNC